MWPSDWLDLATNALAANGLISLLRPLRWVEIWFVDATTDGVALSFSFSWRWSSSRPGFWCSSHSELGRGGMCIVPLTKWAEYIRDIDIMQEDKIGSILAVGTAWLAGKLVVIGVPRSRVCAGSGWLQRVEPVGRPQLAG